MIKLNKSASDTRLCTTSPKKRFATFNFFCEFPGFFLFFVQRGFSCAYVFFCLCVFLYCVHICMCLATAFPGEDEAVRAAEDGRIWEKNSGGQGFIHRTTHVITIFVANQGLGQHIPSTYSVVIHTRQLIHWNYEYWPSAPLPSIFTMLRKLYIPKVLGLIMNRFCRINA